MKVPKKGYSDLARVQRESKPKKTLELFEKDNPIPPHYHLPESMEHHPTPKPKKKGWLARLFGF